MIEELGFELATVQEPGCGFAVAEPEAAPAAS